MNYNQMTDFEINSRVALLQGYDTNVRQHFREAGLATVKTTEGMLNFCSSWTDAGPIIEKCMISLEFVGMWRASNWEGVEREVDDNPLRAAMIVFLMIMEGK